MCDGAECRPGEHSDHPGDWTHASPCTRLLIDTTDTAQPSPLDGCTPAQAARLGLHTR
jgi:hypothetical protein